MSRLQLTYAGLSYLDRSQPLESGAVEIPGVDLNYVAFRSPGDLFRRQSRGAEFPSSEMSLSTFVMLVARGDDRFVGIPVFISRNFRHSQVYVNAASGVSRPDDLVGRHVGVVEYQMTAALWVRAFLHHDHGVAPADVRWWEGGLLEPGFQERFPVELPPDVRVGRIPPDRTLEGMLASGDLDALVTVQPPRAFGSAGSPVRRLFPDHRRVEREYYERTGLFPIMHLVVLRRDVYEADRWLAASLLQGFSAAKLAGQRRLRSVAGLAVGLPWLEAFLQEVDELFGGDAFPYGVPRNRQVIEAACRYSYEQGLSPRVVAAEELFAPEVLVDPVAL
ncbi:MAG: ABC transporter substrate-binding protein [Acidimicrobiales bacterium]